jgi:DUF4097 and DUF4098 domain-containing protein YvlB
VNGPIRLELSNTSGTVSISGSVDGKVYVHADIRASGMSAGDSRQRLDEIVSNPPIEQRSDTIRIGKDLPGVRNLTISYTIEVPRDTEVVTTVVSGSQTVHDVRGPVKAEATSGSIRVEHVTRSAQLSTVSGSIAADDIGDDLRASSTSGTVTISNIKGDVEVRSVSGSAQVAKPTGRVEANTSNGAINIQGATNDVKARSTSGGVTVQGNPAAASHWDLRTVSGRVQVVVPPAANFRLSAEAVSGQIKTDIPIVIEEQSKHSLRAHAGTGGARVEVHTVSGEIRVRASQ